MPQSLTNPRRLAVLAAAAAMLLGLPATASAATTHSRGASSGSASSAAAGALTVSPAAAHSPYGGTPACATPTKPHVARCLTLLKVVPTRSGRHANSTAATPPPSPVGLPANALAPADLQKAHGLTPALLSNNGYGQTVAIVDAYGYPQAEADLAVYRKQYGLGACTKANRCLRQLNQQGSTDPAPPPVAGSEDWQVETALDLDMVSAACPHCSILLVEGNSPSLDDLGAAVDTAVAQGADDVSNSYATPEGEGLDPYLHYWQHRGVPIVASSGDSGFGTALFPAVIPGVLAVGGTETTRAKNTRGYTETAWSLAGSGCSAYFAKPKYQPGNHCFMRLTADVSATSDNIIIYNSTVAGGYAVVAGTSASAPFIAGVIGLAGNASTYTPQYSYTHTSSLYDVTGGTNAQPNQQCGTDYLCNGLKGYDGPTGVGSPNGLGAF